MVKYCVVKIPTVLFLILVTPGLLARITYVTHNITVDTPRQEPCQSGFSDTPTVTFSYKLLACCNLTHLLQGGRLV